MRQRIEQNEKPDGLFGVRVGVWLTAFGLMTACVLTIELSRHTSRPKTETASQGVPGQDSSARPQAGVRRMARKVFTSGFYESGASYETGEAQFSLIEQMIQDRRQWMDSPEY